jgi:transcriptional repressor NrdR
MRCPACQNEDTKVVDSRPVEEASAIRRRRECEHCEFRFSTYEEMEILDLFVVKRDGRFEQYRKEKLITGIEKALEKRPMSSDHFRRLVSQIEQEIQKKAKDVTDEGQVRRAIGSAEIGDIVMKRLKRKDQVAYIRFASVYRQFADVENFIEEIKKI